ncbi:TIGR04197 family type VII secretion effector [Lentibacillus sp. N15]|uniref:TIGR04197 family type VII secretion effector n=1 Tax=Lentibacillus songyuanensis TaxID=3136161 RepID=UPI0031BB6B65
MSEKVSIDIGTFNSNIKKLRSSLAGLEIGIEKDRSFDKTNITPFTDDLENTMKAIELLSKYKNMLDTDITTLEGVGESMKENDERLAAMQADINGPQPLRS